MAAGDGLMERIQELERLSIAQQRQIEEMRYKQRENYVALFGDREKETDGLSKKFDQVVDRIHVLERINSALVVGITLVLGLFVLSIFGFIG